jgi:ketosteroid isomerase-like protein
MGREGLVESQNKLTVRAYMAAFEKGYRAAVLACLTDDVVWDLPGAFHLEGKEAFEQEVRNIEFEGDPRIDVTRLTEEDDVVIAEGTVRTRARGGEVVNLAYCDVFEMRGGKIRRLVSYLVQVDEETLERLSGAS